MQVAPRAILQIPAVGLHLGRVPVDVLRPRQVAEFVHNPVGEPAQCRPVVIRALSACDVQWSSYPDDHASWPG